ncbi:MAG: hypothetical protein IH592_13840 [Bacteroidales bacterium]|nr:hypothetical protein [Bacteroidales bacterium]
MAKSILKNNPLPQRRCSICVRAAEPCLTHFGRGSLFGCNYYLSLDYGQPILLFIGETFSETQRGLGGITCSTLKQLTINTSLILKDMKIERMLFVACLIGQCFIVSAQQYATDKKATIIAGTASFMSSGGDLFEDLEGNNSTSINISPVLNHFIIKNLYIGGGIELVAESQGDYSYNGIGLGPQVGYMFGGPQSKAIPYLDLGLRYYRMNMDYGSGDDFQLSGSDLAVSFGVLIPIKTHIGLYFEGGYHIMDLKDKDSAESFSGNVLSIGVGIAGLFFNSDL